MNAYLDVFNGQVFQAKKVLMQTDQEITVEAIKNLLTGQSERKRTILQAFKEHNDQVKSLSGRDYAIGTVNRYKIAYEHTAFFIKWKYDSDDLELRELNYEFVSQFAYLLKCVRMYGHNSAIKYFGKLQKGRIECIKKAGFPRTYSVVSKLR